MIFDGVFDRHPGLKGMSMEHTGFWLPSWLRSLDYTAALYKRQRKFSELPSDTAKQRIKVSPFAGEPVGWIKENSCPDMLCFASDYPHPECTSDPIGKFEATMGDCTEAEMEPFCYGNMAGLMGLTS